MNWMGNIIFAVHTSWVVILAGIILCLWCHIMITMMMMMMVGFVTMRITENLCFCSNFCFYFFFYFHWFPILLLVCCQVKMDRIFFYKTLKVLWQYMYTPVDYIEFYNVEKDRKPFIQVFRDLLYADLVLLYSYFFLMWGMGGFHQWMDCLIVYCMNAVKNTQKTIDFIVL